MQSVPKQNFSIAVHSYLDTLEEKRNLSMQNCSETLSQLKTMIPAHVMDMTLDELRALNFKTIEEIRTPLPSSTRKSKIDDGYATGHSTRSRTRSRDASSSSTQHSHARKESGAGIGPFQSASKGLNRIERPPPLHSVSKVTPAVKATSRVSSRRRSRSADSNGGILMPRPGMRRMTPMNQHNSR